MKKLFLILFLTLFIPLTKVDGACTYEEIARLKKIASNVNVSYTYTEGEDVTFHITLVNLNEEIKFIDSTDRREYFYNGNEITISNYKSGDKISYRFYPTEGCTEQLLYTISLTLPTYNKYYKDSACIGIENYSLCQKWSTHNYDYDTFLKKVEEYKSQEDVEDKIDDEIPIVTDSMYNVILEFLLDYYYVFLIVLIIGSSIGIYTINKKSDIYN